MNDLYIHQLETENKQIREQLQVCRNAINEIKEELHNTIDAKDKIINYQALEIARLKEQLENDIDRYEDTISYQLGFDKGKEELKLCDETIDKLTKKCEILEENNELLIQQKHQMYEDLDIAYKKIDNAIEYIKEHSEMTDLQICGIENVLAFRGSATTLLEILGEKE